ncbi:hypothetical protein VNI00_009109 [Paramarasmius palmivorus]|uniref:Uncharacterized protein n=1 Tax=Paramarasmius palmivorus TaxID=297713 RepID=A0AAW0CSW2_9AGAR
MSILEEILEPSTGDSQTPDAPSNMAIIEGSSNVTIAGSHLNNVVGPQYNTIYHGNVTVQRVNRDSNECQRTLWDEFTRIRTGDVYIKQNLCVTDIGKDPEQRKLTKGRLKAYRTIKTAHLTNKNLDVLYIGYSGDDAVKVRKLSLRYLAREIADPGLVLREMWIDPSTGWVRKGPYVESSASVNYIAAWFPTGSFSIISDNKRSLTLQEYNADVLQKYLLKFLSIHDILQGVRLSAKYTVEWANDGGIISVLSSLPGTIYNGTSLEPIAHWSGYRERCYYVLHKNSPATTQEHTSMEDGSVRLTFALADMQDFPTFWLQYLLGPAEEWIDFAVTWLSLAHNIFHQLGINRDEWQDYCGLTFLGLGCECERRETPQGPIDIQIDTSVYLFIHPIPRPSDDESTWNTWVKGRKYFWSFDPSGKEEISDAESEQRNLGLPSLKIFPFFLNTCWGLEAYDIVQALHTRQGFDPTSTALDRSLDHPDHELEIINPDSGRFEEDISNEEYWTDDVSERLSTVYEDEAESWYAGSDDSIEAQILPSIDQGQDNTYVVDEQSITPNREPGLDRVNVDEPLRDMMGVD